MNTTQQPSVARELLVSAEDTIRKLADRNAELLRALRAIQKAQSLRAGRRTTTEAIIAAALANATQE